MDRNDVNWRGYIPAITTPFDKEGNIDWNGWDQLLEWLVQEGVHGIVVNGTTGEWFSQTVAEQRDLLRRAIDVIQGRIPVMAGCTAYTPQQVTEQAQMLLDHGASGILVAAPPYVVPAEEELVAYYQYISDRVDIPICVYNWPRGTNVDMNAALIERLARIEHVVAIKNSTGNPKNFEEAFFAVKDQIRYFGFPMNEYGANLVLEHNGDGTMGAGAVLGRDHAQFYNLLWEGCLNEALDYGKRDCFLFNEWFNPDFSGKFGSPQAVVKAALNLRGLPGGYPRRPILPLKEPEIARVERILRQINVEIKDSSYV